MRTILALLAPLALLACDEEPHHGWLEEADSEWAGKITLTDGTKVESVEVTMCLNKSKTGECQDGWLDGSSEDPKYIPSSTEGATTDIPNPFDKVVLQAGTRKTAEIVAVYGDRGFDIFTNGTWTASVYTGAGNLPTWMGYSNLVVTPDMDVSFITEDGRAYVVGGPLSGSYTIEHAPFLKRSDVVGEEDPKAPNVRGGFNVCTLGC